MSNGEQWGRSDGARFRFAWLIPNTLSAIRILLGLAFAFVSPDWRIGVLLVAAASDLLDGFSSRMLKVTSVTGQLLDPVADKIFVLSVLATLLAERQIGIWHLLGIASRDLSVIVQACWLRVRQGPAGVRRMKPSWLGKLATAMQLAFLASVVLWRTVDPTVFLATALSSAAAAIDYWRRIGGRGESPS
jgi:phosphatidylglycerophosphate synthase